MVIHAFYLIASLVYGLFILAIYWGLRRLRSVSPREWRPFVSVIVPARNEERTLLDCLESLAGQSYPLAAYEVIIVDDDSQDRTKELARRFVEEHGNFRLISLAARNVDRSPKKLAIAAAVESCRGEIILTTDADSIVPKQWIEKLIGYFDHDVGAVASWLQVRPNAKLLSKLESLDAFSLVLVAAGAMGLGKPFLANGANFGYRKQVYEQLNGFAGIDHYASGDDDLFLLKIRRQSNWRVVFVPEPETGVWTQAKNSYRDFLSQRIRWASKGSLYPLPLTLLQSGFYLFFLAIALGLPFCLFFAYPVWPIVFALALKLCCDYLLIRYGSRLIRRELKVGHFLLAEAFQICYLLVVGILGQVGSFQWKGRLYTRGKSRSRRIEDLDLSSSFAPIDQSQKTV